MSRLIPGNPLLENLSRVSPLDIKHKVLIFLIYAELIRGQRPSTTKQISKICEIEYNTMNQVLRRMRDYGLVKSKKGITSTYVLEYLESESGRKKITVNMDSLPEYIGEDTIIEKKWKRVIHWFLTNEGRRYGKFVWFNPKKYKIEEFLQPFIMTLEEDEGYNDYVLMLTEENDYKDQKISNKDSSDGSITSEVKPLIRNPDIEKYAKLFAADHFREQGYEVMVYDYPIFGYDLEIIKDFKENHVMVRGIDVQENKLTMLNSEIDLLINKEKPYILCIVKMQNNMQPVVLAIYSF